MTRCISCCKVVMASRGSLESSFPFKVAIFSDDEYGEYFVFSSDCSMRVVRAFSFSACDLNKKKQYILQDIRNDEYIAKHHGDGIAYLGL
jgi:hypothetical protein